MNTMFIRISIKNPEKVSRNVARDGRCNENRRIGLEFVSGIPYQFSRTVDRSLYFEDTFYAFTSINVV